MVIIIAHRDGNVIKGCVQTHSDQREDFKEQLEHSISLCH